MTAGCRRSIFVFFSAEVRAGRCRKSGRFRLLRRFAVAGRRLSLNLRHPDRTFFPGGTNSGKGHPRRQYRVIHAAHLFVPDPADLLDALRNSGSDKVAFELNGPLSPVKVLPVEGDDFIFLVMPVRFKND